MSPGRGLGRISFAPAQLASVFLSAVLVATVGAMLVPLPTILVDLLLVTNLALAVVVVLSAVFVRDPLQLSALPTLLLVSTLFRLSLNVSTTRLILLQADAGAVVDAFGAFVVRGNYIVGAVVFLTITLIQFVVVARGSERVAEVGARFALDAMPGKQMSIDSERRSGAIGGDEAGQRRIRLQRESEFYGAMDGAMKFVKGDAIAGLVVIAINLLGGLAIGSLQRGLAPTAALQQYGLLTVGDGLVSQLPALLIAVAAGIVVTRVSSEKEESSLAHDLATQLFGDPRPLFVLAAFMLLLAVIPGLPALPFLVLAAAAAGLAFWRQRVLESRPSQGDPLGEDPAWDAAPLVVELPREKHRDIAHSMRTTHLPQLQKALVESWGLPCPAVAFREHREAGFAVRVHGVTVHRDPTDDVTDAEIITAIRRVVQDHCNELLGLREAQAMLKQAGRNHRALVEAAVPGRIDLQRFTAVLRRLAQERVTLRPLTPILDALAELTPTEAESLDSVALTERVRSALRRRIVEPISDLGTVAFHRLDPMMEDALRDGVQARRGRQVLALPRDVTEDIIGAIVRATPQVLVVHGDARPFLAPLLRQALPDLAVLSQEELEGAEAVQQVGTISP